MSQRHFAVVVVAIVSAFALGGCGSHADVETIGRYGGFTSPKFSGPLAECPPVSAVDFSTMRQTITDDDFANLFPALQRLNPRRVCLGGQPVTDKCIDLLNQLPYLQFVNLEGTKVTPQGLGRLKLSHWE
jgi:hypothetical protein